MNTILNQHWTFILGYILIAAGTVLTLIGSAKNTDKDKKDLSDQIREKNNTIDSISITNTKLLDQSIIQNKRIIDLSLITEKQSEVIKGYAEGFNNHADFEAFFNAMNPALISISLKNASDQPVYGITGYWIDLDEPTDFERGKFWTQNYFNYGDLYPSHVRPSILMFDLTTRKQLRLNFFVNFRKGSASQEIRVIKDGDIQKIANRMRFGTKVIYLQMSPGFPGFDPKEPDKIFQ